MTDSLHQSRYRVWVELAPQAAAAFGIFMACTVLMGWALDIGTLKSVLPNQPQMVPNTALSFVFACVSLWLLRKEERRRWNHAALLCASAVLMISVLTLTEYVVGADFGIDKLFFGRKLSAGGASVQSRPSPHTASNFLLLGVSLLLLATKKAWLRRLSQYLAVVVSLVALLAIVGYSYRVAFLYSVSPTNGMALHTALTFLVLGIGCVSAQTSRGMVLLILSDTAGGIMARYLLPAAFLLPIIFGGLIVTGQRFGLYETAFGMALVVIASVLALSALIWRNAQTLYRVDIKRQQAEGKLRRANQELEIRVAERTEELSNVNRALRSEVTDHVQSEAARLELLRQLVNSQEEERRRISRELHDRIGQHLSALMLGLKTMRKCCTTHAELQDFQRLEALANQLAEKMHRLAWELRPTALDDLGLDTALSNYLQKWSELSGVEVEFGRHGEDKPRLPSQVETTIYRVVQEALTNVVKHAGAQRVSVVLESCNDQVVGIVEDDGKGFNPDTAYRIARGLGLLGMKERVALVGGAFDIDSEVGAGTTVIFRIPTSQPLEIRS